MKTCTKINAKEKKQLFVLSEQQLLLIRGGDANDTPVKDKELD